jgi:hypothetical protein
MNFKKNVEALKGPNLNSLNLIKPDLMSQP